MDYIDDNEKNDMTIADKRQALAEMEFEMLDERDLLQTLLDGCKGWNNMTDEEVESHWIEVNGLDME